MDKGVVRIKISVGELLDRISILEIKAARFESADQRERVDQELKDLRPIFQNIMKTNPQLQKLFDDLKVMNSSLWEVEGNLRNCERDNTFDQYFIDLARSVYQLNDKRSAIKNQVNQLVGSPLSEEKDYSSN